MSDYTKDGVLHCGTCNKPKEKILTVLGKDIHIDKMCDCEKAEEENYKVRIEEQRAKDEKARRQEIIERNRKKCFESQEQMNYTFDNDDNKNEISKIAKNYADKFEELNGLGLLLYGSVGTGKTFSACCIANALIDKGYKVLVTNFPKIANELQSTFEKQEYIDKLVGFDLLVIDDLASERRTEYMDEMVTNVIDSRYRNGKPVIITTNLKAEDMVSSGDVNRQRIYSRLYEMCYPYETKGEDRRKNKRKNIKEKYKGVLEND